MSLRALVVDDECAIADSLRVISELRYREYKKDRGSDADAIPVKRRLAEIHANRILKLDRTAKQDEPASEGYTAEFPVEEPAA
jgi:hypothetical protein